MPKPARTSWLRTKALAKKHSPSVLLQAALRIVAGREESATLQAQALVTEREKAPFTHDLD